MCFERLMVEIACKSNVETLTTKLFYSRLNAGILRNKADKTGKWFLWRNSAVYRKK